MLWIVSVNALGAKLGVTGKEEVWEEGKVKVRSGSLQALKLDCRKEGSMELSVLLLFVVFVYLSLKRKNKTVSFPAIQSLNPEIDWAMYIQILRRLSK